MARNIMWIFPGGATLEDDDFVLLQETIANFDEFDLAEPTEGINCFALDIANYKSFKEQDEEPEEAQLDWPGLVESANIFFGVVDELEAVPVDFPLPVSHLSLCTSSIKT